jgi:hypothetical protein
MMMSTKNSGKRCLLGIAGLLLCVNSHAYSGGDGTEQNPYLISSKSDMEQLASEVYAEQSHEGDYFLLTRDLTAPEDTITGIIGVGSSRCFSGIFDGGNHEIAVNINFTNDAGLFGYVEGATIKNLSLSGSVRAIRSTSVYVGGICAHIRGNARTTITNCYNKADIYSESEKGMTSSGGICGSISNRNTIINKCYNMGNILSKSSDTYSYSGGICGYTSGETGTTISISNCYNAGYICSETENYSSYVGGIVGDILHTDIVNCYNTGNVSSSAPSASVSGGIAGSGLGGEIKNCFVSNCQIANIGSYTGRIGGVNSYPMNKLYANNYAESITVIINGEPVSDQDENNKNGKDITLANLQNKAWLASNLSWDFNSVWKIKPGEFPTLRDEFDVTSILPVASMLDVSVYPNPVQQYLHIQSDYPVEKVEIYDQTGMIALRNAGYAGKMDVSALSKGIYVLKVYTGSGMIYKKIVIGE